MSVDGTKLLFEGFLQKRKDTIKIRWVTYWFRLQNTTLFFYTKKNGSASHLRGHYYIYTVFIYISTLMGQVQSVREVQRFESRRFMFEIIMTNGKRKVLAAETAALRKEWVGCLWQAMNLSASVVSDSGSTQPDMCERLNSNTPICSHADTDSVMESLSARPLFALEGHIHQEIRSIASSICLSEEPDHEEAMQSTPPACSYQLHNSDSPPWSSGLSNAGGGQEGDYDILPLRNKVCEISASTDVDENMYDFPLAYRRAVEHHNPTEGIYDVPSSLMRRMADHPLEEQSEDRICWMI